MFVVVARLYLPWVQRAKKGLSVILALASGPNLKAPCRAPHRWRPFAALPQDKNFFCSTAVVAAQPRVAGNACAPGSAGSHLARGAACAARSTDTPRPPAAPKLPSGLAGQKTLRPPVPFGVLGFVWTLSTYPIAGPFDRWTAEFFLAIRQDSCKKISCQRPKPLAAGHIANAQARPLGPQAPKSAFASFCLTAKGSRTGTRNIHIPAPWAHIGPLSATPGAWGSTKFFLPRFPSGIARTYQLCGPVTTNLSIIPGLGACGSSFCPLFLPGLPGYISSVGP